MRSQEYGTFELWNDCAGQGLDVTYTSFELDGTNPCKLKDTDKPLLLGEKISNKDYCDVVVTVTSNSNNCR